MRSSRAWPPRLELERNELCAPHDGVVLNSAISGPGSVVRPGAMVMEMVSQNERLLIEAAISPQDIESLHPDMAATVQFTACKVNRLP